MAQTNTKPAPSRVLAFGERWNRTISSTAQIISARKSGSFMAVVAMYNRPGFNP